MNTPLDPLNPGKTSTTPPNTPGTFLRDFNPTPTEPTSTDARSTDIPATHVPHPGSQDSSVPQHPSSASHAVTSPHNNHEIQGDTITPETSSSDTHAVPSMLETIIASAQNAQEWTAKNTETSAQTSSPIPPPPMSPVGGPLPPNTPPPKPPKQRTSPATILKLIGSLIIVSIIFFGSFLSYIVFNPDSAGFFITIFGIDPNDIANLLKSLINVSFGTIVGLLAIVWIIALFRAIWTPKAQKRRKFLSIVTAILLGFILFSILTFWIYLFQQIARTNYTNPNGAVLIYDNDLFIHEASKWYARMHTFSNLIGPITLRFDISQNAQQVTKKYAAQIDSYEINFRGAKCTNNQSIVRWTNPLEEKSIICTFNEIRTYDIHGSYTLNLRTQEKETIPINFESIEIKGLIKQETVKNKDGKDVVTLDASALVPLGGTPKWKYSTNPDRIIQENIITEIPSETPLLIGLNARDTKGQFGGEYDRIFVIQQKHNHGSEGSILLEQNPANPQEYTITLTGVTQNEDDILSIQWKLNDNTPICSTSNRATKCIHAFRNYGDWSIQADVKLIGGKNTTLTQELSIKAPLELGQRLRVVDRSGKHLNPSNTFNRATQSFTIKDLLVPETIILDARNVYSAHVGYTLDEVHWTITDGTQTENRVWDRIEFDINKTARFIIKAKYQFRSSIGEDIQEAQDTIVLDLERKSLTPILRINKTSDYVPTKITVDGSQSRAEYSEIIKFIYDFWEGRPHAIGDAIQVYEYNTPGEKEITLTIIDNNGERASTKQTVVLKETPSVVGFTTSLSPGFVGVNVDFIASDTTGQVEEYIWNFGDNTPVGRGYEATHKYQKAGTYTVTLTARYTNGTEKTTSQTFVVEASME